MKPQDFRSFLLPILLMLGLPLSAQAGNTYCKVNVYTAYTKAVNKGWQFKCHGSTFVPEHAFQAVSCQGKTPPFIPGGKYPVKGDFFTKNYEWPHLRNGWKFVKSSIEVSGGNWQLYGAKSGFTTGIVVKADITAPNTSFKRRLKSFKLVKNNGNCSKVYSEAF